MGSVEIHILGQKYTIKGDAPEEHIQQLAGYVQEKIREVYSNSPNITPLKASILAAITIADELHKLKIEQEDITKSIEEKTVALTRLFD
ncbi:MAG TPA: cell division protein ZapA [Thermodesulfovibrionales bacterium]|nr:cell division protein ZapA [Thermodesulfovibrionales bacterium]